MIMRFGYRSLSVLSVVSLLSLGCARQDLYPDAGTFEVQFVLDGGGAGLSRATAGPGETAVGEWCLYIVDTRGNVCDAVSASSLSATRNFLPGHYTAYAIVNCGLSEDRFETEDEILEYSRHLEDEKFAFSMSGRTGFNVPEVSVCAIPVLRLVSKVEIHRISTDFSQYPDLAAKTFVIDSMYLVNVAGESALYNDISGIPALWYNKRRYSASPADDILCERISAEVPPAGAYSAPHYFYCYQNNAGSDSHSEVWSPRHTRLVLACTIGHRKTYYPIDVVNSEGLLARNCRFLINDLVITDLGTDKPDDSITGSLPYRFTYVTAPWEEIYTIDEVL